MFFRSFSNNIDVKQQNSSAVASIIIASKYLWRFLAKTFAVLLWQIKPGKFQPGLNLPYLWSKNFRTLRAGLVSQRTHSLIHSIPNGALCIFASCMRLTQTDYLRMVADIQPAKLSRLVETLSLVYHFGSDHILSRFGSEHILYKLLAGF